MGGGVSFQGNENVLKLTMVWLGTTYELYLKPLN